MRSLISFFLSFVHPFKSQTAQTATVKFRRTQQRRHKCRAFFIPVVLRVLLRIVVIVVAAAAIGCNDVITLSKVNTQCLLCAISYFMFNQKLTPSKSLREERKCTVCAIADDSVVAVDILMYGAVSACEFRMTFSNRTKPIAR